MPIIKCPECQKEISNTAVNCPNCGCPIINTINKSKTISSKNEMYITALLHTFIIAILSIMGRALSEASMKQGKPFLYIQSVYLILSKIIFISIFVFVVISILWIIIYKTKKSDLKILNSFKIVFITLSSYVLSFSIGFLYYDSYMLGLFDFSGSYKGGAEINHIFILIMIMVLMCLFAKFKMKLEINFAKYKLSFIIWGIYAIINSRIFYNVEFYSIVVISIPIIIGVLCGISAIKQKV